MKINMLFSEIYWDIPEYICVVNTELFREASSGGKAMADLQTSIIIIIAAILVLVVLIILRRPMRLVFKLILNTAIGFLALFAINWLGAFIGISVAVNWLNALIVGILGVPGTALILMLRWLFLL
jgi:inhibitor of the pro-sigma K processing machinery